LSSEDGEMLVVEAGPTFKHIATNSMGETLMATPALSEGVMYVRGSHTLFAIGKKREKGKIRPVKHQTSAYIFLPGTYRDA
jgi:hypothetical protein